MVRVVVGALLAAVVLFLWGFVFWVVSPLPLKVIRPFPDATALAADLKARLSADGVYHYPWVDAEAHARDPQAAQEQMASQEKAGPSVWVHYHQGGVESMTMTFVQGFAHYFVSALLLGGLLVLCGPPTFFGRLVLAVGAGLFAAVFVDLTPAIWYHHSWAWAGLGAAYTFGGWLLAGFVLAAFVKPRSA